MLYHFLLNLLFWIIVIIFPLTSVIGCAAGVSWTSHITVALFLTLNFVFDCVFAAQYMEKEGAKYDLKY